MPVGRSGGGHLHPHAVNPTASTYRHIILSPVPLASRDQDGGLSNYKRSASYLRSHGKIGDCEQSIRSYIDGQSC